MPRETLSEVYFNRRMAVLLGLGFASGLPSAYKLLGSTLQAWLGEFKVDLKTITLFSIVTLPLGLKFLWAPLMDRFAPRLLPGMGRRRSWLLVVQVLLLLAIAGMALTGPTRIGQSLWPLAIIAVVVAFLAASQDIVSDAYRTDVLPDQELGAGAAMYVNGYRVAMLVAGGGALLLAGSLHALGVNQPWRVVYLYLALLMAVGICSTLLAPEPPHTSPPASLTEAVVQPAEDFWKRLGWKTVALFALVVLFKLPDGMAGWVVQPFLQTQLGFDLTTIALARDGIGMGAAVLGTLAGGALLARMRLIPVLLVLGLLQALTNLGYCALAVVLADADFKLLVVVMIVENFCAGMAAVGFIALLMSYCSRRYSATQYALFTSLMFMTTSLVGAPTGWLVEELGYLQFFMLTIAAGIPGLVLLWFMRDMHAPPKGGG